MIDSLVSIITPLYNSEKFIEETIESVLNQTYKNWEMLIVDDLSTDKGPNIVKEYEKKDSRIKYIKLKKNSGAAIARNKAIEMAQGEYIAFLDSDDLWKKEKLERQIKFMEEKELNVACTYYELIDEYSEAKNILLKPLKNPITLNSYLATTPIGCLTGIYSVKKINKVYMPIVEKREDAAFWIDILKKEKKIYCLKENLACYRIHSNSVSSKKTNIIKPHWNLYRKYVKLGLLNSFIYMTSIVLVKVLKLKEKRINK